MASATQKKIGMFLHYRKTKIFCNVTMSNKKEKNKDKNTNVDNQDTLDNEKATSQDDTSEGTDNTLSSENFTKQDAPKEEEDDSLQKAKDEAQDWKDKYIRLMAEFDNFRKRVLKEKAELILNGSEKTVTAILPILDDFERALADNTDDPKAIKEGEELIFKKFQKILESLGIKKIETKDADFNVDFHEAIAMVPGMGDDKKGKIIDCVQAGYTLNDKVIRHAKVAVGQ